MNKDSKKYLNMALAETGMVSERDISGVHRMYKSIGLAIAYAVISIAHNMLGEEPAKAAKKSPTVEINEES